MRRPVTSTDSPVPRFPVVSIAVLLTMVLFVSAGQVSGVDLRAASGAPAETFRRVLVPVDRPDLWPPGSWQAVPLDEFQRLLKAAGRQPLRLKPVWIDRAVYSATFVGRSLRGGRLSATVRRTSDRDELLILDPLNLPLSRPAWSDRRALWGTTPAGRTAVVVRSRRGTLHARWSLAGRPLPHGVEFNIRVAPAGVSRLELRLPDGYQLSASAGVVSKPAAAETGWKSWHVDLGSLSGTRIAIGPVSHQTVSRPLVLTKTDTSYVIRREGMQFQAGFDLEIVQAPVTHLRFQIPPELEIDRLTYGGEETLSWRTERSGRNKTIVVRLPDALRGRSRPLRIEGFAATRLGQDRPLPRIRLKDAVFLSGQIHVRVAAPLELLAFSRTGCRQTGIVASAAEGETLTFDEDLPDAQLAVRVGLPPLELSARIITQLLATADDRKLTTEVQWTARSGSTFSVQCSIPADWHLLVVTAGNQADRSRVTNWEIVRRDPKRQVLSIEFLDALAPDSPKTVHILARRGTSASGRIAMLPVVRPTGCRSVERLLSIAHPATITVRLRRASLLKPIRASDLPEFVRQSPFGKQIGTESDSEQMRLYANTESASAVVSFSRADPPLDVDLRATLQLSSDRLVERQQIDVTPRGASLSRLFIYLTTSGPPFRWTLHGHPETVLVPQRIPESQYAAWNLPDNSDGELWEVTLPRPVRKPFRVVGTRSRLVASRVLPALAFVPGATKFHGRIDLTATGGIDVDTQVRGLQQRPASSRPGPQSDPISRRRSWAYRGPDGALVLRFQPDASEITSNAPAALSLRSLISPLENGNDVHQATFSFSRTSRPKPFHFELPSSATLISVRLNGKTIRPRRRDRRYALSVLPANRPNTVEIRYRSSSRRTSGSTGTSGSKENSAGLRSFAVPRGSCTVVAFDWFVALPPGVTLASEPDGVRLDRPIPPPGWSARLFGPLGRPNDTFVFSPFSSRSWQYLFTGSHDDKPRSRPFTLSDRSFPPAGWNVVHGTAARLPDVLTLKLHNVTRSRLIAWLSLMAALIVGLALRTFRVRPHRVLLVFWFSLCLTAAWLAPAGIAQQIAAGSLAGTFLAWILPKSLLTRQQSDSDSADTIPTGSTLSLPAGPVTMGLLAVGCLFVQGAAQERSSPDRTVSKSGTAAVSDSVADPNPPQTVLIPVDSNHKPLADLPVVYLTKQHLAQLRTAAARHGTTPRYLISSADYQTTIDARNFVTVEARYHIVTLADADKATQLTLRVADGNPTECLVNGQSQPIFRAPGGEGIVMELKPPAAARQPAGPQAAGTPVIAPRPTTAAARFATVHEFDVLLKLHPRTSVLPIGSGYAIGLPRVADSHLSLHFADRQETIDVAGARSTILPSDDHLSATADLGKIDRLMVTWSDKVIPVRKPPHLEVGILCRTQAQPTQIQFRYHLAYRVLSGPVDFVVWNLPSDMLVRAVTSKHLLSYSITPTSQGRSRLLIEFKTPQEDGFTVEATLLLPVRKPGARIGIPAVNLVNGATTQQKTTIVTNQIGIGTPTEFRLSDPKFAADQAVAISTDSLMSALSRMGQTVSGFGKPQFAYQLSRPTAFSFAISPLPSGRTVRLHQTGRIGSKRLTWTATAEITVDPAGAPVFQHRLRVDPRLTIQSLSVKEDAAERLIRYTRQGDQLTLFLSDGSTGIQDLVLKGTMPLPLPGETRLPTFRFENAAVTKSDLVLLREAAVIVDLPDTAALEPVRSTKSPLADGERAIPIGRFRLPAGAAAPVIRMRRSLHSIRADLVTVVQFGKNRRRTVTTCIRYHGLPNLPAILRLRLPEKLASDYRLVGNGFDSRTEARPDGSVNLLLIPHDTSAANRSGSDKSNRPRKQSGGQTRVARRGLTAVLSATLRAPATGEWVLPAVEPLDVSVGSRELYLPARSQMQPVGISAEKPSPRALPLWVRRAVTSLPAAKPQPQWSVYPARDEPWTLTATVPQQANHKPRVLFVGTVLRPTVHGTTDGSTEILFLPAGADHLDVIRSDGLKLRALFVDGSARPLPKTDGARLSILIEQPLTPRQIVLDWTSESDAPASLWSRHSLAMPQPHGVPVDRSIVTLVPPSGIRLLSVRGMSRIDWTTVQGDRNAALQTFRRSLAESRIANPTTDPSTDYDAASPATSFGTVGAQFVSGRVVPNAEGRAVISFRPLEERLIVGILAVVAFGVLIPVGLALSRIGIGPWLRDHSSVAWMLLGLVWWICLTPGVIGPVLILLGLFTAVRRRQRVIVQATSIPPVH